MYLFDTNIFLEVLLAQSRAERCLKALQWAKEDAPGWVTAFSVHAIEAVLGGSKRGISRLPSFLEDLSRNQVILRYETTLEDECEIAKMVPALNLDFDDALQYWVARKKDLTLVTLDKDFKKITDIPVVSPEEI